MSEIIEPIKLEDDVSDRVCHYIKAIYLKKFGCDDPSNKKVAKSIARAYPNTVGWRKIERYLNAEKKTFSIKDFIELAALGNRNVRDFISYIIGHSEPNISGTNLFHRQTDGAWKLVLHHGSPMSGGAEVLSEADEQDLN